MKKQEITNIEPQPSRALEGLKWFAVFALTILAIAGFYYFSAYPLFVRVIGMLVATAVILLIAERTNKGGQVWEFIKGARSEARKVVWPPRKETTQLTIIVLVVVLIASIALWVIDLILFRLIALLTG